MRKNVRLSEVEITCPGHTISKWPTGIIKSMNMCSVDGLPLQRNLAQYHSVSSKISTNKRHCHIRFCSETQPVLLSNTHHPFTLCDPCPKTSYTISFFFFFCLLILLLPYYINSVSGNRFEKSK